MSKIDFKVELKHLYRQSSRAFSVVEVPPMQFLMVDGHGDPNSAQEYRDALEALYAVAFKLKFMSKREMDRDYVVPPLEGLWWAENMETFSSQRDKSAWDWTMMIMQPEWIAPQNMAEVVEVVSRRKELDALPKLRLERYHEGMSVQILHVGSYEEEGPLLRRMHADFIPGNGFEMTGKHHEIYLSDPRKVAPEKLKTILRQPVRKMEER